MAILGSASRLFRSLKCPASNHLPQKERKTKAATRGTSIHLWLERMVPDHVGLTLPVEDGELKGVTREWCEKIDVTRAAGFMSQRAHREVASVWAPDRPRILETARRNYGRLKWNEVPGTIDVIRPGYGACEVWDYKTGYYDVARPKENPQLLHAALIMSRTIARNAKHFVLGIQKVASGGRLYNIQDVVDLFDLEAHEERLFKALGIARKTRAAVEAKEVPEVFPGEHCQWCPAQSSCPEGSNQGEKKDVIR